MSAVIAACSGNDSRQHADRTQPTTLQMTATRTPVPASCIQQSGKTRKAENQTEGTIWNLPSAQHQCRAGTGAIELGFQQFAPSHQLELLCTVQQCFLAPALHARIAEMPRCTADKILVCNPPVVTPGEQLRFFFFQFLCRKTTSFGMLTHSFITRRSDGAIPSFPKLTALKCSFPSSYHLNISSHSQIRII